MAHPHGHGKFSSKKKLGSKPEIFMDRDNDFASIKIASGIEAKSYLKDGFVFSEDAKGRIIEIQILNLSLLSRTLKKAA